MAEHKFPIRTELVPAYYREFQCIAGACQDSCCHDPWNITFHKKDYLKIKRAPKTPEFDETVRAGMARLPNDAPGGYFAHFRQDKTGRCRLLTEEGLCSLQLACGGGTLPEVCKVFPRLRCITPCSVVRSLGLGCEGVLALLWDLPGGIDFVEDPLPRAEWLTVTAHNEAAARFGDIRSLCIDVLQCRALPVPGRLVLLGKLLEELKEADFDDVPAIEAWLARGEELLQAPDALAGFAEFPGSRPLFLSNSLHLVGLMRREGRSELAAELTDAVAESRGEAGGLRINADHYGELEHRLDDELLGGDEYFFENLVVALAFSQGFPGLSSPEALWKSYVNVCNVYAAFRFAAVCACHKEVSRERLFHVLVQVSRTILHNKNGRQQLVDSFFRNDSATLAHMAILVGG